MKRVRKFAKGVSRKTAYRNDESSESSHDEYHPGSGEESHVIESAGEESFGDELALLLQLELGIDPNSLLMRSLHDCDQRESLVKSPTTVVADTSMLSGSRFEKKIDQAIMNMFMGFKGVVGIGSSGIVVRSHVFGKDVAVKVAFNNCNAGTAALRREISTYLELHRERSPLLGSVLPNLVLAWNSPSVTCVYDDMVFLVTEFVGRGLVRDRKGILWIGDAISRYEEVDREEEQMIYASALNGLQCMRENRRLHGDIALRNLRAERIENSSGVVWQTWWVDLGLSSVIQSRWDTRLFAVDCVDSRSLFKI